MQTALLHRRRPACQRRVRLSTMDEIREVVPMRFLKEQNVATSGVEINPKETPRANKKQERRRKT